MLKPWANGFELSRGPQHQWIIDFGIELSEGDSALYEQPLAYALACVKPERVKNNREAYRKYWWRFAKPCPGLRRALKSLPRFVATVAHSKHRFFVWLPVTTSPDQALITVARADNTTFGILHSRFHELWSLRMGTSLEDRPRYTPTTCFETFPFHAGLSPADTTHQRTEEVQGGALIPAGLPGEQSEVGAGRMSGAILRSEAYEPPAFAPATPGQRQQTTKAGPHPRPLPEGEGAREHDLRATAAAIATAAKKLNDLREAWLNPPEWTDREPEVVPLGMTHSPYPDRIVAKPGFEKELTKRTLTNLYNLRPAWLNAAHEALDAAVAAAYGWADYTPAMPDEEILKRLLALNLERANGANPKDTRK